MNYHISKFTANDLFEWILAISIFLVSMPVFIWDAPFLYTTGKLAFIGSAFLYFYFNSKKFSLIEIILLIIYSYIIIRYSLKETKVILSFFNSVLFFGAILLIPNKLWSDIFKKYILIFSITILPAIIQYCLMNFLGIQFPYHQINSSPWNSHDDFGTIYLMYSFFVQESSPGFLIPRFYGIYDEPGVVGTIAMVILYSNKFNLKKWYNVVVLIAGILSYSLFFYLSTLIYIFIFSRARTKIIIIVLLILISGFLYSLPSFQNYVINRLIFENGEFVSFVKRSNVKFDNVYTQLNISELLFGTDIEKKIPFATTYKFIFAMCGVIPFAFYMFYLLHFMYNKFKRHFSKDLLLCMIIPFLIYSQRPFITNVFYVILVFVPIFVLSNNYLYRKN